MSLLLWPPKQLGCNFRSVLYSNINSLFFLLILLSHILCINMQKYANSTCWVCFCCLCVCGSRANYYVFGNQLWALLLQRLILPLSSVGLFLEVATGDFCPFCASMSIDIVIVPVLFRQIFVGENVSQQTSWYSGSYNHSGPIYWYSLSHHCGSLGIDTSIGAWLYTIHWSSCWNLLWSPLCVKRSFFNKANNYTYAAKVARE